MTSRLPPDAFQFYVSLGDDRSYSAVARRYDVSKRAVSKRATREDWQARLERIERDARERADQKAVETLEAMSERHLKVIRFVQGRALEALRTLPLSTGMEAVRALDLAIKQERTIRGEPSDRTAVAVEDVIKREAERWLGPDEDNNDGEGSDDDPSEARK